MLCLSRRQSKVSGVSFDVRHPSRSKKLKDFLN